MERYYFERGYICDTLKKHGYKMNDFSMEPHSYICSKSSLQNANARGHITKKMWDKVLEYIKNNSKNFIEYEWHNNLKNKESKMITFFDKSVSEEYGSSPCVRLMRNHIGEYHNGYIVTEQYPYGCLAIARDNDFSKNVTTYKGNEMVIGYVDRKFIPLCDLENF